LADAKKALTMFQRVNVPTLGLIENMSYFICPKCEERHDIFSTGGGKDMAEKLGLTLLGRLPLYIGIREGGDQGLPVVLREPDSEAAALLRQAAANLAEACETSGRTAAPRPSVVFQREN
jgi:ATP-binding protein involved in chromosome partitioning